MRTHGQSKLIEISEMPETTDDYGGLNWSYSRRESLDHCTRRYFMQYYATALEDAKFRARVEFLRGVKNRHLRTGELVHLVIGTYFKKLKLGRTLSADWLAKWAMDLFRKDQKYSAHIRCGGAPAEQQYPPVILDEIVNEEDGHSGLFAQAEEQMLSSIKHFFTSPAFSEFRSLGASPHSYIERKLSLKGFPARVSGKVDLAAAHDSSVTIVDWKIGSGSDAGAESLQLATYGLWGASEFGVTEGNVRIAKAHLLSQEVVEFKAGQQAFANARVRIFQDLERMVILHRYGKLGAVEAFTPNPQKGVCRLCPFREVCPEGKAVIDA
jgi:PD-(D/E)XK nuclease superfamily